MPQAWSIDSLDASKRANNNNTLDILASILKDYPQLFCELRGTTDVLPQDLEPLTGRSVPSVILDIRSPLSGGPGQAPR